MSYVVDLKIVEARLNNYVGESNQCVAAVKALTGTPQTKFWKKGARVKGNNDIKAGTAIATFNSQGKYHGHAAIYISQDEIGITVYDQWDGNPLSQRQIKFKGFGYVSNDGDQFYVIE